MTSRAAMWKAPAKKLIIAVTAFVALNALVWWWKTDLDRARRENLLLDAHAQPGAEVRYDLSSGEALGSYLRYIPDAQRVRLITVVGMSQMYSINDLKAGDATIAEHLDDLVAIDGARSFGVAAPNLSNEEALFVFETLTSTPQTKPAVFVYGVCFDKFRNVDLRPGYQSLLRESAAIANRWQQTADSISTQFPTASRKMFETLASVSAQQGALSEDKVEDLVRGTAARALPVVSSRKEVSSFLLYELFLFRNWLFNIKPTSKRPVLASRYELNWQFLKVLAQRDRENDVQLVLYVIPLNPLTENPYVPAQYEQFKAEIESFCQAETIPFANFENVVPAEDWGEFMGGPDYKHFRGEGHRLTAEAIYSTFRSVLLGK